MENKDREIRRACPGPYLVGKPTKTLTNKHANKKSFLLSLLSFRVILYTKWTSA
jgi:hypothetical protein